MKKTNQFMMSKIFPLIFMVLGLSVAIAGLPRILKANASKSWPTAQGQVTLSELGSTPGSSSSSGSIFPNVKYTFAVEDVNYTGTRIGYSFYSSSNNKRPGKIIGRYPKGMDVTVHYMPENPEESVLEAGIAAGTLFLSGIGLAFLFAGLLFAYLLNNPKIHWTEGMRQMHTG